MNGEDVVIGGRYVVGPEPTFKTLLGTPGLSALLEGQVVTALSGVSPWGNVNADGLLIDPRHLTPYIEPDAAGEGPTVGEEVGEWVRDGNAPCGDLRGGRSCGRIPGHRALTHSDGMGRQWEAETVHLLASPANAERLRRNLDEAKAARSFEIPEGMMLVAEAGWQHAWNSAHDARERAEKAEGRLKVAHDDVDDLTAELDQLRAAPQLPADLPVVESVEQLADGAFCVHLRGGEKLWMGGPDDYDARTFAAASLAVLAAEAEKPDPVEELAQVLIDADDGMDNYSAMARAAIAWTEKRDA